MFCAVSEGTRDVHTASWSSYVKQVLRRQATLSAAHPLHCLWMLLMVSSMASSLEPPLSKV